MENKYQYLHKYRFENLKPIYSNTLIIDSESNFFSPVNKEEIIEAENLIGFEFPTSLKKFWLEIGKGRLLTNNNKNYSGLVNDILSPIMIVNTILRKDESEELALPVLSYVLDMYLEEGDIPFMEVADSSDFLKMKRGSDGIYDCGGDLLEESFEKFIWRLYHESAKYYLYVGQHPATKPE